MNLEDYQKSAVQWLVFHTRGIVVAPAGSGKTIIAAAALDRLCRTMIFKPHVGWIAHTIEQKQQALSALSHFPDLVTNAVVRVECAASETDWSLCDILVVDEVHWAGCDQWSRQIHTSRGWRWGFTATPFTEDHDRNELLLTIFDHHLLTIKREEVIARLAPAQVIFLQATDAGLREQIDREIERTMSWRKRYWTGPEWELKAQASWNACIKLGIVKNSVRNIAVIETAKKHAADSVLILVNEIDHAQILSEALPGSKVCFSKLAKGIRRSMIEDFRTGKLKCLIATSLADEGLDVPNANVLILVSAGRSSAKTEQRTGRVLRAFAGKEQGLIYDFWDVQHPMMLNHSKKRLSLYRKLGYQISNA